MRWRCAPLFIRAARDSCAAAKSSTQSTRPAVPHRYQRSHSTGYGGLGGRDTGRACACANHSGRWRCRFAPLPGHPHGHNVDPPNHFIEGGAAAHALSLDDMIGPCVVRHFDERYEITEDQLEAANIPEGTRRLLLSTPSADLWDTPGFHTNYTGLSLDGAQWCVRHGIRLVGIDYLSIERVDSGHSLANSYYPPRRFNRDSRRVGPTRCARGRVHVGLSAPQNRGGRWRACSCRPPPRLTTNSLFAVPVKTAVQTVGAVREPLLSHYE